MTGEAECTLQSSDPGALCLRQESWSLGRIIQPSCSFQEAKGSSHLDHLKAPSTCDGAQSHPSRSEPENRAPHATGWFPCTRGQPARNNHRKSISCFDSSAVHHVTALKWVPRLPALLELLELRRASNQEPMEPQGVGVGINPMESCTDGWSEGLTSKCAKCSQTPRASRALRPSAFSFSASLRKVIMGTLTHWKELPAPSTPPLHQRG